MKTKVFYWLNFLWTCFIAFTFPICFGLIYLNITGHSKGYSYDLGSEKDVSVLLGIIELVIWLVLALPSNIYVFSKTKKISLILLIALYIILAIGGICLMGGFSEFAKMVFNMG